MNEYFRGEQEHNWVSSCDATWRLNTRVDNIDTAEAFMTLLLKVYALVRREMFNSFLHLALPSPMTISAIVFFARFSCDADARLYGLWYCQTT